MKKKVAAVQTTSTPAVLSLQGKDVNATYTVEFPAKYFKPKAILRITPVIVYDGGELAGTPVYVQGTKVKDNYTVIDKNSGGKISQSVSFPYNPQMRQSVLELRVDSKCANKGTYVPFAVIPVADGVSTVQELADLSGRPAYAPDNFQRNTVISQEARIMFLINKADVRPVQLNSEEIKTLEDFIVENSGDAKKSVGNIYIKAYASPDGPTDFNSKLSQDRARNTETALNRKYAKDKLPGDLDFDVEALGEDWEGFKELVEASDIPDKNLILQVLQMYNNPEQREREIKNMSSAFNVLKEKILPELRRSKLRVDVDVEGLSDAEIRAAVASNIANLNLEEMLFAATLYDDLDQKANIYKAAADKYNDYRAWNNYGAVLLQQGKVSEAGAAIQRASQLNNSSNEVINNLGLVALGSGNNAEARRYLTSINTEHSAYNTGLLHLADGNYSEAVKTLEGHNLAVAEVLNGNPSRAKSIIASETCGYSDYLKAVIAAKEGDSAGVTSNLRSAVEKNPELKERAQTDIEFAKWFGTSDFNNIVR
ncbi:MAG: hypothetical protein LIO79_02370 [Rikenellaceae bacterium]|nr:hypothetical protein [Rikenellaceae bacterium]